MVSARRLRCPELLHAIAHIQAAPTDWHRARRALHRSFKNIRWAMGTYITLVHLLGFWGFFQIARCQVATLWFAFLLWPITGFGITGGAHRLWAHRSYTAGPLFRGLTMLANSCANQGSIWHWSRDHRTHHFHSETVAGTRPSPPPLRSWHRMRARLHPASALRRVPHPL